MALRLGGGVDDGIFISYRRDGGSEVAQVFKEFLEGQGFRVFLDVEGLTHGRFDAQILAQIEGHAHLLLVCSPGCLDRCADESDWIRKEVSHALKLGRNIVPVTLPGFDWPTPTDLPEEIRDLQRHNAFSYVHEHWGSIKHKLASHFGKESAARSPKMERLVRAFLVAISKVASGRATGEFSAEAEHECFVAAATELLGNSGQSGTRDALEEIVQQPKRFSEAVHSLTADQPEVVRDAARVYFKQLSGTLQSSLRRSSDRSGRTIPRDMPLAKPDDLLRLIPSAMPRFSVGQRPVPGTALQLIGLLGKGGFGEVWRARHLDRPKERDVVLKFCIDERAARSLKREAELLRLVKDKGRHRYIVDLLDTHLDCSPPCLEYEFVEGGELAEYLADLSQDPRRSKLTAQKIAAIMAQITEPVMFAHQQDIVHRDLKPQNVLVVRKSRTELSRVHFKITDFGIGGVIQTEELKQHKTATSTGSETLSRGTFTPIYSSPQQQQGAAPDKRDDVFALGVIWYQILTDDLGKGVPSGGGWKTRLRLSGVTDEMLQLLEGCMESEVDDRIPDAGVLFKRLTAIAESKPEPANVPIVSPPTPSLDWAEVLEKHPDPSVVASAFVEPIRATGLPWRVRHRATGIELLLVPHGKFMMGSAPEDPSARSDESPRHLVLISRSFYIGRFPVTQEQWARIEEDNPSDSLDPLFPVEKVRWDAANQFCEKADLRLPTEAEWEYACRAGSTRTTYGDIGAIAWYSTNSQKESQRVGRRRANGLGLFDTIGLVWEWCSDRYRDDYYDSCARGVSDPQGPADGETRVNRGGSFGNRAAMCRAATRGSPDPEHRVKYHGFRVVRDPSAAPMRVRVRVALPTNPPPPKAPPVMEPPRPPRQTASTDASPSTAPPPIKKKPASKAAVRVPTPTPSAATPEQAAYHDKCATIALIMGGISLLLTCVPFVGLIPPFVGLYYSKHGRRSLSYRWQAEVGVWLCALAACSALIWSIIIVFESRYG